MLNYTRLGVFVNDKHYSFLGTSGSYEENEVCIWPKKLMLNYSEVGGLASDKHFSLLGTFGSFKENKVLCTAPGVIFSLTYESAH